MRIGYGFAGGKTIDTGARSALQTVRLNGFDVGGAAGEARPDDLIARSLNTQTSDPEYGSKGGTRTPDPSIMSAVL
jgi:hypothetical protein